MLRVLRISPERAKRSIAERLPTLTEEQMRELDKLPADRAIALGAAGGSSLGYRLPTLGQLRAPRPTLTNFDGEAVVSTKVRPAVAKEHRVEVARFLDSRRGSRARSKRTVNKEYSSACH